MMLKGFVFFGCFVLYRWIFSFADYILQKTPGEHMLYYLKNRIKIIF